MKQFILCTKLGFIIPALVVSHSNSKVLAKEISAVVATNFYSPFRKITAQFENQTGHKVQIIAGSTGKLYAQIINGAPFEIFLAGDQLRPFLLERDGRAVPGTRMTYALGKITLWSSNTAMIFKDGIKILREKKFNYLAIANPKTAPYGRAAWQILQKLGLWEDLRPHIVEGENIGQAFQFVISQNADLGFVALSQVLDPKLVRKGKQWHIPESFYNPLRQDVVILKSAEQNFAVKELWKYLRSDAAKEIIKRYGYGLAN